MALVEDVKNAAVTYHRVSTVDQDPTLARDELRRVAAARGLELVAEIEETGSGARNDRPGLRRVLELAQGGRVAFVLVWKLDRFGRSALDVLGNVDALERAGVTFVATSQGLEVGPRAGATGRLLMVVLSAVAEFERAIIRERTAIGLEVARRRGRTLGRPRVKVGTLASVRIGQLRAAGWSWAQIAAELEAAGLGTYSARTLARLGYLPPKRDPAGRPS